MEYISLTKWKTGHQISILPLEHLRHVREIIYLSRLTSFHVCIMIRWVIICFVGIIVVQDYVELCYFNTFSNPFSRLNHSTNVDG